MKVVEPVQHLPTQLVVLTEQLLTWDQMTGPSVTEPLHSVVEAGTNLTT